MQLIDLNKLVSPDVPASESWSRIVEIAVLNHASDIHLTFQRDGFHVAFRIDGQLQQQGVVESIEAGLRLTNHVKVEGSIDLGERRRPQNGRAFADVADRHIDLRISALPTNHGQDIVVRILDRTVSLLDVEQLGLPRREVNRLLALAAAPNGLVLVTGPTGAGKTTTLYAILNRLNDGSHKIITIENPVEYDITGINQSQVNYRLGIDFSALLLTVLQQDPDVIMIGEVRDAETSATAVRAAVTGHLVLATTHAISAATAVDAIVALGAHPHFLACALRGVVAQNLVRRVCSKCAERIAETESVLPLDDISHLIDAGDRPALSIGRGCAQCYRTGYRGRMGLFEIMIANDEIRHIIEQRGTGNAIHQAAIRSGMLTLQQVGKLAAFLGQTSIEEIIRVLPMQAAVPAESEAC